MLFQVELLDAFPTEEEAFRWLFTPVKTLGNRTPIEMLAEGGQEAIMDILRKERNV